NLGEAVGIGSQDDGDGGDGTGGAAGDIAHSDAVVAGVGGLGDSDGVDDVGGGGDIGVNAATIIFLPLVGGGEISDDSEIEGVANHQALVPGLGENVRGGERPAGQRKTQEAVVSIESE